MSQKFRFFGQCLITFFQSFANSGVLHPRVATTFRNMKLSHHLTLDACRLEPSRVWSHIGAVLVNLGDERVAFVPKGYRVSNVFISPLLFWLYDSHYQSFNNYSFDVIVPSQSFIWDLHIYDLCTGWPNTVEELFNRWWEIMVVYDPCKRMRISLPHHRTNNLKESCSESWLSWCELAYFNPNDVFELSV